MRILPSFHLYSTGSESTVVTPNPYFESQRLSLWHNTETVPYMIRIEGGCVRWAREKTTDNWTAKRASHAAGNVRTEIEGMAGACLARL